MHRKRLLSPLCPRHAVELPNRSLHLTIASVTSCAGTQAAPATLTGEANVRPTDGRHRRYRRPVLPWAIDHHSNPGRNTLIVEAQVTINGSKAAIWAAITNIENASETISGIENIEVLEKPENGLVGLRW